jgi:ATP-dependent RNA helicase DeaD
MENSYNSFSDFNLSNTTLTCLSKRGFIEPTSVQQLIIPKLLQHKWNVVGQAQTGTGKTVAFGIPIIENIASKDDFVGAVVVLPTRELVSQCAIEISSLVGHRKINVVPVYGGVSIDVQIKQLKTANVVVATPGRLLDHIRNNNIQMNRLSYLVLDEADEMLSLDFIEDIEAIFEATNKDKIVLMFSATFPKEMHKIASKYMQSYEHLKVHTQNIISEKIKQKSIYINEENKYKTILRIIESNPSFYGIIFCNTKIQVERLSLYLEKEKISSECLHSDISQVNRERALNKFKNRNIIALVATDIAARGIDIKNVNMIINHSIPRTAESYVHRIGRTGRSGMSGTALTLVTPNEISKFEHLVKNLSLSISSFDLQHGESVVNLKKQSLLENLSRSQTKEDQKNKQYLQVAQDILRNNTGKSAEHVISFLLEHFCENEFDSSRYEEIKTYDQSDVYKDGVTNLFFSRGKNHNMTDDKIKQFLYKEMYIEFDLISNIKILKAYSFFTVPTVHAKQILEHFSSNHKNQIIKIATQQ